MLLGFYYIVRLWHILKGMTRLIIYIWKLLINKDVANVRMKKNLMNTSTAVSVVNISRNISLQKPRQEERTKETEPPKKKNTTRRTGKTITKITVIE